MSIRHIVLGLGYGDEGKGIITTRNIVNYIGMSPMVIRFSSGHQVGHTVHFKGEPHTYSNFPSGYGLPFSSNASFYWSKNCTICPSTLYKEFVKLRGLVNYKSNTVYFDMYCPITTPYDILANQKNSASNPDISTIGVGFGTTIKRHTESPYKLYLTDILAPNFKEKLDSLKEYYVYLEDDFIHLEGVFEDFFKGIELIRNHHNFDIASNVNVKEQECIIFEGNQGFMLDQERGVFPHVTRAYTTGKQAYEMLDKGTKVILDLVTRAYSTRHSRGEYRNEEGSMKVYNLIGNPKEEINVPNSFQGDFRLGTLYSDELKYAIGFLNLEAQSHDMIVERINLHITCLDQTKDQVVLDNQVISLEEFNIKLISYYSRINIITHRSPSI